MTLSATTAPVDTSQLSDKDLYESYRNRGLSHADAVLHVERRRRAANQPVENIPAIPNTSPEQAAILGMGRTATSGFQDELVGILAGLRGPDAPYFSAKGGFNTGQPVGPLFNTQSYTQARDQIRTQQNQALVEHPGISFGSGFLGAQVNPLNYLIAPLTKFMTPGQAGLTYGTTFGAAQGAGEGESKLGRLTGAAGGAAAGALVGGTLGYVGSKINAYTQNLWKGVQPLFQSTAKNVAAAVSKDVPEEVVNGLTETSVRAQLAKDGFKPQQIEDAVVLWKNGGKPPAPQPSPPTVRPGETITPTENLDKSAFARRGGTVRQDVSPISGNRSIAMVNPPEGRGTTLPWYPRGGAAEQRVTPFPVTSNPPSATPPGQVNALVDYLRQAANPQEAIARLGTLRDLGIPTPGDPAQVLSLLFGGPH